MLWRTSPMRSRRTPPGWFHHPVPAPPRREASRRRTGCMRSSTTATAKDCAANFDRPAAGPRRTEARLSDYRRGLRYLFGTGSCIAEARSEIVRSQTSCPPETVGAQSPKGHQRSQGGGEGGTGAGGSKVNQDCRRRTSNWPATAIRSSKPVGRRGSLPIRSMRNMSASARTGER